MDPGFWRAVLPVPATARRWACARVRVGCCRVGRAVADRGPGCRRLQVGIQMNYNKLCACIKEDSIHPNFEHALAEARPCIGFQVLRGYALETCGLKPNL